MESHAQALPWKKNAPGGAPSAGRSATRQSAPSPRHATRQPPRHTNYLQLRDCSGQVGSLPVPKDVSWQPRCRTLISTGLKMHEQTILQSFYTEQFENMNFSVEERNLSTEREVFITGQAFLPFIIGSGFS